MPENLDQELLLRAKKFFRENIVNSHVNGSLKKGQSSQKL